MPPYLKLGSLPPKRHIAHPNEPGYRGEGIHYEEVVTTQGFSRAYSIVYHLRPPTRVKHIEAAGNRVHHEVEEHVLRHHHFKTKPMPRGGDPVLDRVPLLFNSDVTLSRSRPAKPQVELYRNAAADEILFIHEGRGHLLSMFGRLPFKPFDYVVIPRGVAYMLEFDSINEVELFAIETPHSVGVPPRYMNADGQLRLGASVLRARLSWTGGSGRGRSRRGCVAIDQGWFAADSLCAGASPI